MTDLGLKRCPWPGEDALYIAYHDEEWGVPEYDDRALFEKLVLDGFQAGLSWITILRKRENFRRAFDGFAPEKIARYRPAKIERLMQDAGIVRNRAKIEGSVLSARGWLEIMDKGPGFSKYLWDFVDGRPKVNHFKSRGQVPAETKVSQAMSKDLAQRGFKFCGPTIVYAFMQAVGMVNDHLVACHRHEACAKLGQKAVAEKAARHSRRAAGKAAIGVRRARIRAARLAAHAVGTAARSARPLPARHRDRGHRAWAGARGPLERTDQRRAYFLGRAALPAGRGVGAGARAAARQQPPPYVLLHDAPEYVIGDMISPFKAVIGDAYKATERRLLTAIHLRFGLPAKTRTRSRGADQGRRPAGGLSRSDAAGRLRRRPRRANSSAGRRYSRRPWSAIISSLGPRRPRKRAMPSGSRN